RRCRCRPPCPRRPPWGSARPRSLTGARGGSWGDLLRRVRHLVRRGGALAAHRRKRSGLPQAGRDLDRLVDLGVPRATAQVAAEGLLDLLAPGPRALVEQRPGREHRAGLAEAALQG